MRNGGFTGISIAMGTGLCGIDLDFKAYRGTGIPSWAEEIVREFATYTEWSPSGKGLHLLFLGTAERGRRLKMGDGEIEFYPASRFLRFTGQLYEGTCGVRWRQRQMTDFVRRLWPPREPTPIRSCIPSMDDEEILRRAFSARNGARVRALYEGDISAYGNDRSRADLALASMLGWWCRDPAQLERLLWSSALAREKWRREDYMRSLIERAMTR